MVNSPMTYYVCSSDTAAQYCSGMKVMYVVQNEELVYYWDINRFTPRASWPILLLIKDINEETRLILTLVDPLFREVTKNDMQGRLLRALDDVDEWVTHV